MDLTKPVSGRELARLTGQSEGAVRKAKNRGSILNGLTSDGKFIPAIACKEWGKPVLKEFLNEPVELADKPAVKPNPKTRPIKPIKQKKEPEKFEDIAEEIMHEKLPSANADDLDDETVSEELYGGIQKPEAERVTAVLKAKILQITYKEKQGQLVPIDKVNSVLFGYGQEIRNSFESMPDRIIDKILSVADKRHEAKKIMSDEIHNTLELLADINSRELK